MHSTPIDPTKTSILQAVAPSHHEAVPPDRIRLADFPQLRQLAWHIPGATELSPPEALNIYERHWRHLDLDRMDPHERELLDALRRTLGRGYLLV
ncbi:MAG: hypothetical protein AB3X44_11660 [Leptothrix sp. (in: b-proteobacteria)]